MLLQCMVQSPRAVLARALVAERARVSGRAGGGRASDPAGARAARLVAAPAHQVTYTEPTSSAHTSARVTHTHSYINSTCVNEGT